MPTQAAMELDGRYDVVNQWIQFEAYSLEASAGHVYIRDGNCRHVGYFDLTREETVRIREFIADIVEQRPDGWRYRHAQEGR